MADDKPVKLSVELPGALYRELLAYAEVHAKATGLAEPLLPEKIAVPMIERFMRPIGASRPSGGGADGGGLHPDQYRGAANRRAEFASRRRLTL